MPEDTFNYDVRCKTCRRTFKVQLFESHSKNLFLVDKKDWYCDPCKKDYARQQTARLTRSHQDQGFPELTGSAKMVTWAEKIRAELINKVNYLQQSLRHDNEAVQKRSARAFEGFIQEWQVQTTAQWWIDHRRMTVRDISTRVAEIAAAIDKGHGRE
ncbi:MAG: hypothetical protein JJV98_00935 [Desulfosarcina sp.]|nr:hypothetical protein [Desulfobacterales bacterium]